MRPMWVGVGVGVGVRVDFSTKPESESLKFGRLRSPDPASPRVKRFRTHQHGHFSLNAGLLSISGGFISSFTPAIAKVCRKVHTCHNLIGTYPLFLVLFGLNELIVILFRGAGSPGIAHLPVFTTNKFQQS